MILVIPMAMEVAIKKFTVIFLVLSCNDHSVKISSNSEMGSGMALWYFFGFLRQLVLNSQSSGCIQFDGTCLLNPRLRGRWSVMMGLYPLPLVYRQY